MREIPNFATVRSEETTLKPGMVVDLGGPDGLYEVTSVNLSRARLTPLEKTRTVTIKQRFGDEGDDVTFQARRRPIDVSPNSEVRIISWNQK